MISEISAARRARGLPVAVAKLQHSRAYDLAMRLPLLGWSAVCTTVWVSGPAQYARGADPGLPDAVWAINLAMRLSTIAFLVLLAASVLLRARPSGKARGLEPRVSALVGTFIVYTFSLFPRRELSLSAEIVATSLTLTGSAAAVFVLTRSAAPSA
jgi:hypothetical protein